MILAWQEGQTTDGTSRSDLTTIVHSVNINNPQYRCFRGSCTHDRPATSSSHAAVRAAQHGRTLVELLIAIVLSLMIMAAVGSLYYFTSQSARTSQQVSSAEERGRIAAFHLERADCAGRVRQHQQLGDVDRGSATSR